MATVPVAILPVSFFDRPAEVVAPELLGCGIERLGRPGPAVLRIVEVEAYLGEGDRASHAWHGRETERNRSLFLPPGHVYVFLVYGLHHCFNAVTGGGQRGGAVLVRAGEPVAGVEEMIARRGLEEPIRPGDVAGGPGKLCQAIDVDRSLDGRPIESEELRITAGEPVPEEAVATGPRVGVDYAGEAASWPLRFALRGNPHVSRPRL